MDEVFAMDSSEIVAWQAYFAIVPFTQEREDRRFAMLASVIANVSGKSLKQNVPETVFVPNYFDEPEEVPTRSLEEQKQEALAFRQKYSEVQGSKNEA